jgi:hypothetical protein
MVLFTGKIRRGENVYLHKLPMNGPDGRPQFVQGGNSREWHSRPDVESIKPTEIKAVPVNRYLDLIRKATPQDWAMRKRYMKKQGVSEGSLAEFAPDSSGDGGDDGFSEETLKRLAAQWWQGDEDPRVERTLAAAGWEIGQDESYDDEPGVFVVQAGDVNGNSYISWPAHELKGVSEGRVINTYLWHGSRHKNDVLVPRQAVDTGGAAGSNQRAIYATNDPKVAIAMGLTTSGSDTGMFPNDPQMVLFTGKIRRGENVYLHKLPMNGPDGRPQFVQGGNPREWHSRPDVESIKPTEIKAVPVNRYLDLIRKATPQDWAMRKRYMKKQSMTEGGKRLK